MYPKSIFDLPRKKEDLISANQGMSNLYYDEIAPLRNIADSGVATNNFGNGLMSYRWHPASGSWWIPSRSYFRIDCELTKSDGTPLVLSDNIAVNMGAASCLFSKQQYKINDKTISEISEHVAQVDAIKTRLRRTGRWLETTGDNFNMWSDDFVLRQNKVILDGIDLNNIRYNQISPAILGANNGHVLDFLDLETPNQVEFTILNLIIFTANAGAAIPDLRNIFQTGERVHLNDGLEKTRLITKVEAAQLTVDGAALTAVGAGDLVAQVRYNIKTVSNTSSKDRRVKNFSLIYQPPLSIFGISHAIPGSSKHEIDLVPFSDSVYQKNFIESVLANKIHTTNGVDNDFRFKVVNMFFYAARCDGPIIEKDEFFLDLEETRAQISTITVNTRTQFALDISPATHAITIAFQDESAETNTLFSQSKFKIQNEEELNLTNFYIRYGGIQKPQPDFRPLFDEATNTDRLVEQYGRSVLYNGSYYDSSIETLEQWRERGIYLHFPWPKTGTDRETRVYVSTQFSALTGTPRLLLFNHFNKVCILKYENGSLNSVIVNEV